MSKVLVIGASVNPSRFANKAIKSLMRRHYDVVAIGKHHGLVEGVSINTHPIKTDNVHTVLLFLRKEHQSQYYDYILDLRPKRVVFNPGAENDELLELLKENDINAMYACGLVMINNNKF